MKVLFLEHVVNVAKEWEIKNVSSGYAVNFLFPKKLAKRLTPELEKKLKNDEIKIEANRRKIHENRLEISNILNWKELIFSLKIGKNWKIYWWVGEKDIIKEIKKQFKISLERKNIYMPSWHIKKVGKNDVYIKLSKDVMAKMSVVINPSNS